MIEARGLSKRFGRTLAVDRVSFDPEPKLGDVDPGCGRVVTDKEQLVGSDDSIEQFEACLERYVLDSALCLRPCLQVAPCGVLGLEEVRWPVKFPFKHMGDVVTVAEAFL